MLLRRCQFGPVFIGDKLLTEENPQRAKDKALFNKLGLTEMA